MELASLNEHNQLVKARQVLKCFQHTAKEDVLVLDMVLRAMATYPLEKLYEYGFKTPIDRYQALLLLCTFVANKLEGPADGSRIDLQQATIALRLDNRKNVKHLEAVLKDSLGGDFYGGMKAVSEGFIQ